MEIKVEISGKPTKEILEKAVVDFVKKTKKATNSVASENRLAN